MMRVWMRHRAPGGCPGAAPALGPQYPDPFASGQRDRTGRGEQSDFFDSNGPLRGIKRDLYEAGSACPLLRGGRPHRVRERERHRDRVLDFLLQQPRMRHPVPGGIDAGRSPAALFEGCQAAPAFIREFHERGFTQAVRTGDWKGVRLTRGTIELYDLKGDIEEENNIAAQHRRSSKDDTLMRNRGSIRRVSIRPRDRTIMQPPPCAIIDHAWNAPNRAKWYRSRYRIDIDVMRCRH